MAYTNLTVLDSDKDGDELIALMVAANTQGTSGFECDNDGKVILIVLDQLAAGAGDTLTLEGNPDKFGRDEAALARTITAQKIYSIGPFMPEMYNQTGGKLRFAFTTAAATTSLIAIRVANPK